MGESLDHLIRVDVGTVTKLGQPGVDVGSCFMETGWQADGIQRGGDLSHLCLKSPGLGSRPDSGASELFRQVRKHGLPCVVESLRDALGRGHCSYREQKSRGSLRPTGERHLCC